MIRAFSRACTLIGAWSIALGVSSCSLVLDWSGYTGGLLPGDASDEPKDDASDASDAKDATDGPDLDARNDGRDVEVTEAAPPCGPLTCGGCCNADGFCAGGESTATCGMGGEACTDCGKFGQTCSKGACSSMPPPSDSGPPPACAIAACPQLCIPVWQGVCCKTDGTCGCQVTIPPMPACN